MVLKLYSGTPGSGKSLDVARKIYHALRYGRPVIANFDINTSLIPKCRGTFISLILAKNHMVTKPQIHVTIYLKIIKY